ncbi:hypothetical protein BX616_003682 [Lobosporangium transversale]|uniref:Uncharacterized protein n=1 Tax=Lobosporangium transversale TaxID=64571 RepID=A0A1Y2GMP2_9FUNG|nr:hypothetical protein BCR41DRAFT_354964 [Lobosporangium transversale]KAF9898729.1 hypothetical protein BX616_003682 [Lobosporangium transversale]ORZ13770.1 hypothetical protein BCR41DRAFT_354964 [Lobosporangium transversale]|eukprot:XP_021880554.1 hypothetical protein BCR41DRAFT_354964 [Lobosporangium transversale]
MSTVRHKEESSLQYQDTTTTSTSTNLSLSPIHKHQPDYSLDQSNIEDDFGNDSLQADSSSMSQQDAEATSPLTPTTTCSLSSSASLSSASSLSNYRRAASRLSTSTAMSLFNHTTTGEGGDRAFGYPYHHYRTSFISRRHQQARTLSEELSTAVRQDPEDNYSSPSTPSGLLPNPADLSTLSSSPTLSSSSLSSSTTTLVSSTSEHFPLFKPSRSSSQQNGYISPDQKPKPSPLALHNNYKSQGQGHIVATGRGSPTFSPRPGSPTSAVSHDCITATDIAGSPRTASAAVAANLSVSSSTRSSFYLSRGSLSSSSVSSSGSSSPRSSIAPCSALCLQSSDKRYSYNGYQQILNENHHSTCQYYNDIQRTMSPSPRLQVETRKSKSGRATKAGKKHGAAKTLEEEDPMNKLTLQLESTPLDSPSSRPSRPLSFSGSVHSSSRPSPRITGYYKAKTARPYRSSRQSYCGSGGLSSLYNMGHPRSPSMPGQLDADSTDAAFLRMEAQLNNLIAEGKRALGSQIEVWDEE